jgi:hypothetical protein
LQIIELTCANRKLWAALRTELTTDKEGKQLLDEVGRPLQHTFGAMFSDQIRIDVAASEISRLTPPIKEELSKWLASSSGARTLPNLMATVGKGPPHSRSKWPIVVGAAAIILSIAMGAANLSLKQQVAEVGATLRQAEQTIRDQENKLGRAEQTIQDLQTKLEKAEQRVRDLQPKP